MLEGASIAQIREMDAHGLFDLPDGLDVDQMAEKAERECRL